MDWYVGPICRRKQTQGLLGSALCTDLHTVIDDISLFLVDTGICFAGKFNSKDMYRKSNQWTSQAPAKPRIATHYKPARENIKRLLLVIAAAAICSSLIKMRNDEKTTYEILGNQEGRKKQAITEYSKC